MIRLEGGDVSITSSAHLPLSTLSQREGFNTADRAGLEPATTRCFKPPLYHWSYLSIIEPLSVLEPDYPDYKSGASP